MPGAAKASHDAAPADRLTTSAETDSARPSLDSPVNRSGLVPQVALPRESVHHITLHDGGVHYGYTGTPEMQVLEAGLSDTERQPRPLATSALRIAVLETGTTRSALRVAHGNYPEMLIDLISDVMPGTLFTSISVVNGDPVPGAREYDGYVIMGSRHSVHDDFPWIDALKKLSRDCADRAIPQVGICFGHQLIAEALGGRVERSANGWIAGLETYTVLGMPESGDPVTISSLAYHQEQVASAADGATVVLAADSCPLAGLIYEDKNAFSVQCHPEFRTAYASGLIEATTGDPLEPVFAEQALRSLTKPPDRERMARAIAAALTGDGTAAIVHALADEALR